MTPRCHAVAVLMIHASIALLLSMVPAAAQPSGPIGLQTTASQSGNSNQAPAWLVGLAGRERPISLREALSLAEGQNLDARRAVTRTRIAQQELRESRLGWIPAVGGSAGFGHTSGRVQGSFGNFENIKMKILPIISANFQIK